MNDVELEWLVVEISGFDIEITCNGSTSLLLTKPTWPSADTHWRKLLTDDDDMGTLRLEQMEEWRTREEEEEKRCCLNERNEKKWRERMEEKNTYMCTWSRSNVHQ